jgi:DMSO/TMAO reductase YedYZ heme-binding membrane subunit
MTQSESILTFIIVAFAFALIIIWQKDSLPERLRRPLAIAAIFLVLSAFTMMVVSFFLV